MGMKEWLKKRYWERKKAGLCIVCAKPSKPFVKCFEHRVKASEEAARYERKKKNEKSTANGAARPNQGNS